ncbi:MAG: PAC2 family protein [Actinomycetales bacterium]|nr:PAC2 family protein [Actinomycetales bacterium]
MLVHAFTGFVDAGGGVRIATDHLLSTLDHELIATFDVDEVLDYRARRPRMSFVMDHFESVDIPTLAVHEIRDLTGQTFLLLSGPEPDYQWQRFLAAVTTVAKRWQVRRAIGLSAIPWPTPHTRPIGLAIHGSDPSLLMGAAPVVGEIEVPGHVGAMLEFHLGQQGIPSMGLTAQVPHYLVQFEYPRAAQALIDGLARAGELSIGSGGLIPAAARADGEVAEQLAGNDEFATVLAALEQQYDQLATVKPGAFSGPADPTAQERVPSGDEIAAQVEAFLIGLADDERGDKATDN